jgi:hypothetical protein
MRKQETIICTSKEPCGFQIKIGDRILCVRLPKVCKFQLIEVEENEVQRPKREVIKGEVKGENSDEDDELEEGGTKDEPAYDQISDEDD